MCRRIMTILLAACLYTTGFSLSCSDSLKRITMFWNVENYFDPFNDSLAKDEDFTPEGFKHWTWEKFCIKRNAIAKTIISLRDIYGDYPFAIGLAEVENYMVLRQLTEETILAKPGYGIIHHDGPDHRGIECAMLYRKDAFIPLQVNTFQVLTDSGKPTRDILYVKGISSLDTLEFFVVHFPSKYGGAKATESLRKAASECLLSAIDSTRSHFSRRKIIVMGDFNDTPESATLQKLTENGLIYTGQSILKQSCLREDNNIGTIRFNGRWEMIDHFLVSEALGDCTMHIHASESLLEADTKYLGSKPFRTYQGPKWNGGASDHLPIVLVL